MTMGDESWWFMMMMEYDGIMSHEWNMMLDGCWRYMSNDRSYMVMKIYDNDDELWGRHMVIMADEDV